MLPKAEGDCHGCFGKGILATKHRRFLEGSSCKAQARLTLDDREACLLETPRRFILARWNGNQHVILTTGGGNGIDKEDSQLGK